MVATDLPPHFGDAKRILEKQANYYGAMMKFSGAPIAYMGKANGLG